PVERLSLHDSGGVIVLTPLDGAILAAASRRRGALALLEILSTRAAPRSGGQASDAMASPGSAEVDAMGSRPVHVETPSARFDVFAPDDFPAAVIGELAGHLLSAIVADEGGLETLHSVTVSLGPQRLAIRPVHPAARPPRFVAVVGGPEPSGLLGRQAERVARGLREAS